MDSPVELGPATMATAYAIFFVVCAGLIGYELGRWLAELPRMEVNNQVKESERREKLAQLRIEVQKLTATIRELLKVLETMTRELHDLERNN